MPCDNEDGLCEDDVLDELPGAMLVLCVCMCVCMCVGGREWLDGWLGVYVCVCVTIQSK